MLRTGDDERSTSSASKRVLCDGGEASEPHSVDEAVVLPYDGPVEGNGRRSGAAMCTEVPCVVAHMPDSGRLRATTTGTNEWRTGVSRAQ